MITTNKSAVSLWLWPLQLVNSMRNNEDKNLTTGPAIGARGGKFYQECRSRRVAICKSNTSVNKEIKFKPREAIYSRKLPRIRKSHQKFYHPIIRLEDRTKCCIVLSICLLTIVPINPLNGFQMNHQMLPHQNHNITSHQIYLQKLRSTANGQQQQQVIGPQFAPSSLSMFVGPNQFDGIANNPSWPPLLPSMSPMLMPQTPYTSGFHGTYQTTVQPEAHQISQVAHRRNEVQQQQQQLMNPYQAYQLQPVRPAKLVADYVANQGQRILKNLVNTTIADLVNQSAMMKINANKNQPNLLGAASPFPKINKLYTLLFPTQSPPVVFVPASQNLKIQQQVQQSDNTNQTSQLEQLEQNDSNGSETSVHQPASSSSAIDSSRSASSDMYLNESLGREEKQQQHQVLSLSAPYESQSRPTVSNTRRSRSKLYAGFHQQQVGDPGLESVSDGGDWRRPDNDVDSLSQQGGSIQQQFEASSVDDFNEANSFKASDMDTDSLGSYESAELTHHPTRHNNGEIFDTDARKPLVIRESELYPSAHKIVETNVGQSHIDNFTGTNNHHHFVAESDYVPSSSVSSHYHHSRGSRKGHHPQNHTTIEIEHHYEPEVSSLGANQSMGRQHLLGDSQPGQKDDEIGQSGSDTSDLGAELFSVPRRSERQPKRFQHHKQKHHLRPLQQLREQPVEIETHPLNQQQEHEMMQHEEQQDLASNQQFVNETTTRAEMIPSGLFDGMSAHGGYASEEPSSSSEQSLSKGANYAMNNLTSSQGDDSYFTAHLPSQYDAVMRLPPEGYYDDYFKPNSAPSGGQASLHPPTSFESRESSMADYGAPSQSSGESSGNLIEGAVQYETVIDGLQSAANFTPISDGTSSNRNKKHSAPSYHSQIITNAEPQQPDSGNSSNGSSGGGGSSYGYPQSSPVVGYTKEYYANQHAALRPMNNEARIEFIAPGNNRTMASDERGNLESLNYEIPSIYEKTSASHNAQTQNNNNQASYSNVTLEPIVNDGERVNVSSINNTHRYQTPAAMTPRNSSTSIASSNQQQSASTNQSHSSLNEDSIKLIIANTISDLRDPQSNEKLINYISEGQNITRGKSPRLNFINKDMNEFPPADPPTTNQPVMEQDASVGGLANGQGIQRGLMLQPSHTHSYQPSALGANQLNKQQHAASLAQMLPQQVLLPQFPRPSLPVAGGNQQQQHQSDQRATGPNDEQDSRGESDEDVDQSHYKTVQRIVEPADGKHLSPALDLRDNNNQPRVSPSAPAPDESFHEQHHQDHHNDHMVQQQQPSVQDHLSDSDDRTEPVDGGRRNDYPDSMVRQPAAGRKLPQAPASHHQKGAQLVHREERKRERRARQRGKFSKQQTMPRPQVTQVSYTPKDLVMQAPKALPSGGESPLEALAEIPHKVEQFRENQPDKNELMNELLTALDRVKVAIYKLQPLTAKMNAIYRKSVTSNTRDIIMDNNKGTYAKRYPPGDYDDTYDRMHPSELLGRLTGGGSDQRSGTGAASRPQRPTTSGSQEVDSNESVENAVYLPAPKEILEKHKRDSLDVEGLQQPQLLGGVTNVELDSLSALESKIIATGIGRRLGDGRVAGRLSLDSGEQLVYDDEDAGESSNSTSSSHLDGSLPSFFPALNQSMSSSSLENDELREPLFGYRITIYRSPEADEMEADTEARPSERLAYQLDAGEDLDGKQGDDDDEAADEDLIATSESSLVYSAQQPMASEELGPSVAIADPAAGKETMDGSESKGKKSEEKSSGGHKKKATTTKKVSQMQKKKKKNEEESKKKKEYKKLKHSKGIVSKEKKTMKRDKQIKAHDRGAAKEKALKERTQIEFFEREQIVDDEFEKGKKSTVKGGWQSGQDSKKSIKEISGGGDTMSSGGSHYVKHEPSESSEKGHKVSSEASSGKKSNKFEKKEMEAKGKKFKGWREKGYKIITETEFIDRGSLHDSAYKKRDKGAAQHSKFKKQEASSEGHHGSMLEHHKKSNKKEEKKSNEKKGEEMKKKMKKNKKHEKKSKKGDENDHHNDESLISITSEHPDDQHEDSERPANDHHHHNHGNKGGQSNGRSSRQPMLMSATSSTFRPAILVNQNSDTDQTRTLIRLLNSDVHDDQQPPMKNRPPSSQMDYYKTQHQLDSMGPRASIPTNNDSNMTRYHLLNETTTGDSNRRSDMSSTNLARPANSKHQRFMLFANSSTGSDQRGGNNSTILNIVDNLTGRQINKTKIGTYDLEDHHTIRLNHQNLDNSSSSSTPLVKISNGLAKYFPFLASSNANQQTGSNRAANNMIQQPFEPSTTTRPTQQTQPMHNGHHVQMTRQPSRDGNQQQQQQVNLLNDLLNFQNHNPSPSSPSFSNIPAKPNANQHLDKQQLAALEPIAAPMNNNDRLRTNEQRNPIGNHQQVVKFNTPQTTLAPNLITPEQASAAAHLLQLVQRASQVNHVISNPLSNHQPGNLLDMQSHLNPLQNSFHRNSFLTPTTHMANSYQPGPMFHAAQMNFAPQPPPQQGSFNVEQFADYDQGPILHRTPFTS